MFPLTDDEWQRVAETNRKQIRQIVKLRFPLASSVCHNLSSPSPLGMTLIFLKENCVMPDPSCTDLLFSFFTLKLCATGTTALILGPAVAVVLIALAWRIAGRRP